MFLQSQAACFLSRVLFVDSRIKLFATAQIDLVSELRSSTLIQPLVSLLRLELRQLLVVLVSKCLSLLVERQLV